MKKKRDRGWDSFEIGNVGKWGRELDMGDCVRREFWRC